VTPDEYDGLFKGFKRSAFRLEARDDYNIPDEQPVLAAFRSGQQLPPRTPDNNSWLALVAGAAAAGRSIVRVRVVGRPVTDYTRLEFVAYRDNAAAGETIRVVERAQLHGTDSAWANDDFWLFDDETVALLRYDEEGHFLGAERASDLSAYRSARQRALALSVDLAAFVL
jgi:hypothetical protein